MHTNSNATSYIVMGLQPYQMVSVRVSASTSAGEGPAGDLAVGRARELGKYVFTSWHAINIKCMLIILHRCTPTYY